MSYVVYWGDVPYNFGDVLTANILSHYGYKYSHTNVHERANFFATGSIARLAKNSIVLGSGIIRQGEELDPRNTWEFVRGPLTRNRVLECGGACPEIYGDPALLLPKFCPPVEKKHEIGFVPHYQHQKMSTRMMASNNDWHWIDVVNKDPLVVAKEISSCKNIVASSLHGLIAAQAYDIPFCHLEVEGKLHGDGSKFKDFYGSVGLEHNTYNQNNLSFTLGKTPDLNPIEAIFRKYANV